MITNIQIEQALDYLGIKAPHNLHIGSIPGGVITPATEADWDAFQWNPPQYYRQAGTFTVGDTTFEIEQAMVDELGVVDAEAGAKPTWSDLMIAISSANTREIKRNLLRVLRNICRARITTAYGQDNHHDEIELRLGGRHTEAQDTERERLRTRYSIIKAWIESTDRTLTELEALDLNDDANWTGETWPPVRGGL